MFAANPCLLARIVVNLALAYIVSILADNGSNRLGITARFGIAQFIDGKGRRHIESAPLIHGWVTPL
jgi:hypothetical protein